MIVRIEIDLASNGTFDYRVTHDTEMLYGDAELASVADALVAAVEGLAPSVIGVEVALGGIISGTYTLNVVAMNLNQVAQHANNTTQAILEAQMSG
jgi:hypothetical protein